jgi:phasin family protein
VIKVEPPVREAPIPIVHPLAKAASETKVTVPDSVEKTLAAASDLTAASARAVSETIKTTADTVAAVTAEAVEAASSIKPTKPTLTQGLKSMMKNTEDLVAFGQANLEAFVKSGQIWSAGVQELTKQMATSAKASFEESVSTFKAITTAKSVKEAMELQSSFAKAALEKAMAESNKLTDASIKLTEQTLAPITARVTVAVETFGKAA